MINSIQNYNNYNTFKIKKGMFFKIVFRFDISTFTS